MLGIVCAMEKEARPVIDLMKISGESSYASRRIVKGELCGVPAAVCVCGIGKVNAALGAVALVEKFGADIILNLGVVGSVAPDLKLGDIVVGDSAMQHDFDISGVEDVERGQLDGFPDKFIPLNGKIAKRFKDRGYRVGRLATTDTFKYSADNTAFMRQNDMLVEDMEIAAIAQVCYLMGVPAVSVKAVSNAVDEHGAEVYGDSVGMAIDAYAKKIEEIIRVIYAKD